MTCKPTLTVCIVARNEEDNIGRAIASALPYATEILVVDTGSTDDTVAVAQSMGATVLQFRWVDDFSAARNFALDHAKGDWVLMLDADEAIRASTAVSLDTLLADRSVDAYRVHLVNIIEGRATSRIPILRLFRNKPTYRYHGAIHEQIADSIVRAKGRICDCTLVIEHYGYTEAEDVRKSRRERNLRLLEREVRKNPGSAYLHYKLGAELRIQEEYGRAEWHLFRAICLAKGSLTAARASHRLVQMKLDRSRLENLWVFACQGREYSETRIDSHILCAHVALSHGDPETAARELRVVEAADDLEFGHVTRSSELLSHLKASILWNSGLRQQALAVWQQALNEHPDNEALAVALVRHSVLADGLALTVRKARQQRPSPQYLSAVVGALLRSRRLDMAAELAVATKRLGYVSTYTTYGLAYSGQWVNLEDLSPRQRIVGALALSTAAVWFQRTEILEKMLSYLPESWQAAFESVFWGRAVPTDLAWAVDRLMVHWAEVGCLELLRAGALALADGGGLGRAAWLLWQSGSVQDAVAWAQQDLTHPDSLEVLGLFAYESGDYELAAHFLTSRIQSGPARVQVYSTAARALERLGRFQEARVVQEQGLKVHPWSELLRCK